MNENHNNFRRVRICIVLYIITIESFALLFINYKTSFNNLDNTIDSLFYSISNITGFGDTPVIAIDNFGKITTILSSVIGVILFALTINSIWQYISERDRNKLKQVLEENYKLRNNSKLVKHCNILNQSLMRYQYKLFLIVSDDDDRFIVIDPQKPDVKRGIYDNELELILNKQLTSECLANIFDKSDFRFIWDTRYNLLKYLDALEDFRKAVLSFITLQDLNDNISLEKKCFDFIKNSEIKHDIEYILWSISNENREIDNYIKFQKCNILNQVNLSHEYIYLFSHLNTSKELLLSIKNEINNILKS